MLAGRIAIPLHDPTGRLIGYAGRLVKDVEVRDDNPKYKFPSERERAGVLISFRKSLFLYNGFRIQAPVDDLVVVEGFPSVWWLSQHGYGNVVALMGSSCSPEQASLIVSLTSNHGRVWTFTDGDDGGERCAGSVLVRVGPERSARHVPLGRGEQPTDCTDEELAALLQPSHHPAKAQSK